MRTRRKFKPDGKIWLVAMPYPIDPTVAATMLRAGMLERLGGDNYRFTPEGSKAFGAMLQEHQQRHSTKAS